ncbi:MULTISPECIES: ImmA/IrrE family metallo-endopeptidase [unclassified Paenibacillus]|uniref:ImmA/IrrE family metallo-endopeptidase n=1 Tax=unclassified Paenibacillus TaxID=185978 RepID=UPI0009ADE3BC|nr:MULTISPECIES: ImmA/IrrE family metallo-endopeptidase [unclassified Paenibacillus]MBE1444200.1 hypothetical protein [Paenibacillus sp. OAS669]
MDLSLYKPTETEEWISFIYQKHGICYAADMDIDHIAAIFRAMVELHPHESKVIWSSNFALIYLHALLSKEQQRENFFHELGHIVRHCGDQYGMPETFIELQEQQAAQFQLYAAMPAFMLHEFIHDVYSWGAFEKVLAEAFCLPIRFVQKRLNQILNRLCLAQIDKERRDRTVDTSYITTDYIRQKQAEMGRQRLIREKSWGIL